MPAKESHAWPVRQTWAALTTLYSIGDAVITTDTQGLVELLIPSEALTGWKDEEARGQPLDTILRIIDEETHEKLENPVARVVRDGQIVKLPNHAVLLARDGTARPIAASGAPVRDDVAQSSASCWSFATKPASVLRSERCASPSACWQCPRHDSGARVLEGSGRGNTSDATRRSPATPGSPRRTN